MRDIVRFCPLKKETAPLLSNSFVMSMDSPVIKELLAEGIPVVMTKTGPYKRISYKTCKNKKGVSQTLWDVEFINTGHIVRGIQGGKNKAEVCDTTFPRVKGVGFLGSKEPLKTREGKLLHVIWRNMIDRCYCKKSQSYKYYGAVGVFVHKDWHDFSKFAADVKTLPGWELKQSNWIGYSLDKDYLGSNVYSKDSCIFLSKRDNELIKSNKLILAHNKNSGEAQFVVDLFDFSTYSGVDQGYIQSRLSNPSINPTCGWVFEKLDVGEFVYRPKLEYFHYGETFWSLSNPTSSNKDALKQAQEVVNRLK